MVHFSEPRTSRLFIFIYPAEPGIKFETAFWNRARAHFSAQRCGNRSARSCTIVSVLCVLAQINFSRYLCRHLDFLQRLHSHFIFVRFATHWSVEKNCTFHARCSSASDNGWSTAERSHDFGQQNMCVWAWLRSALNVSGESAGALRDYVGMLRQSCHTGVHGYARDASFVVVVRGLLCYYLRCLVFCTGLCKCKFQVHVVCTTLRYVANVAETIPYSGTSLRAIYFARREKSHNPELQTLFDHLYFLRWATCFDEEA